ncbi:hypothetical protein GIB67_003442 [Kingdonia uniflora]|uniref:Uncharacterized protein n=1 Tax=Kingdonia uniflora TaxID=39325 RepID=A0A7J7P9Y2_9MAGN|nr:hypothetical protein GIB67_003442 [Kingdonia uniflora]
MILSNFSNIIGSGGGFGSSNRFGGRSDGWRRFRGFGGSPSQSLSGTLSPGIGNLSNLQSVRLNNNSLSGPFPESLANIEGLTLVDLSYNYLSGSLPKLSSRIFKFIGNPLICGPNSQNNCSAVSPEPLSFPSDALRGKLI